MSTDLTPIGCQHPEPAMQWLARHRGPWFALIWVPFLLIGPLVDASVAGQPLRVVCVLARAAANVATVSMPFALHASRWSELAAIGLAALSVAYLFAWQTDQEFVYPMLAIATAVAVRQRWSLGVICALTISGAVQTGIERGSLDIGMFLGFATFMAGISNFLVQYLIGVIAELSEAQNRLAQAAVAEERLRFSRDLHDLLGHTLSVIVVKAQAVRRLATRDPEAAAEHASNIETIGRHALTEVREAVTGYRSVGLAEELANAQSALQAAGVIVRVTNQAQGLDAHLDSLLGWVVREGSTNVLKHADAGRCTIEVMLKNGIARVEVVDDGSGGTPGDGSGLTGLRERIDEYGGVLTAGPVAGGFRLAASVPESARVRS
jgi:two-component system sensor histidine kinase DesK